MPPEPIQAAGHVHHNRHFERSFQHVTDYLGYRLDGFGQRVHPYRDAPEDLRSLGEERADQHGIE
ncbi:hypothetical protein ACFO5K_14005 [Nocardia halotolerans]|uniref:Uncharacterized protein n=1 Tax=Nocardia halotolerans TaxID=1755878 RepID=A0ABV8VGS1_9NOCA